MLVAELQPHLYQTFKNIITSDRLSHAYLFSGDFGSFELAIWLAKSLFCVKKQDGLPCDDCRTCHLITDNQFSDVKIVEPQGQLIKTDTIRELTKDFSRSGVEGNNQVFIIRDADKMHLNAANSLLKFIEEPSSQSYMILLTSDDNKILPTIKSRCQIYHFPKQIQYLENRLMLEGILRTQAVILSQITSDVDQAISLAKNAKVLEILTSVERFVRQLQSKEERAYLEATKLASMTVDKDLQQIAIDSLTILLAKHRELDLVRKSYLLRKMWQSNVSFQNALEYFILSSYQ